jgi:hypothetical protein
MKFALVDGQRHEALPNLSGKCPNCDQPMIAKCGEVRMSHWAHQRRVSCDTWWENETEWHRNWKGQFPAIWQEFVHRAENGEKHIADVRPIKGGQSSSSIRTSNSKNVGLAIPFIKSWCGSSIQRGESEIERSS